MNNWISVKDKLPDEDGLVFIYAPSADKNKPLKQTAWYDPKYGWSLLPQIWIDAITHWMYLPEDPNG
jgi:hypothetical protein